MIGGRFRAVDSNVPLEVWDPIHGNSGSCKHVVCAALIDTARAWVALEAFMSRLC